MENCDIINFGLHVIKRCGMNSKECKNRTACKTELLPIFKNVEPFKEYWANTIMLVNQMAMPATQNGYGMAAMNNDASRTPFNESLANFGTAYATTQETMKSQAGSLVAMQGQLANHQQFCMAIG
jgi:hypothetical protein